MIEIKTAVPTQINSWTKSIEISTKYTFDTMKILIKPNQIYLIFWNQKKNEIIEDMFSYSKTNAALRKFFYERKRYPL